MCCVVLCCDVLDVYCLQWYVCVCGMCSACSGMCVCVVCVVLAVVCVCVWYVYGVRVCVCLCVGVCNYVRACVRASASVCVPEYGFGCAEDAVRLLHLRPTIT